MYRYLAIYITVGYIIPIILFSENLIGIGSACIMAPLISFYLPSIFITSKAPPLDRRGSLNSNKNQILIVFFLYLISRMPLIFLIIPKILDGSYYQYALELTIQRYETGGNPEAESKFATIMLIIYAVFLGRIEKKPTRLIYIQIIIIFLIESSALARAGIVLAFFAFMSETIIKQNYLFSKINHSQYAKFFLYSLLILSLIFLYSAIGRMQDEDSDFIKSEIINRFAIYTIAIYSALTNWANSFGVPILPSSFGYHTFTFAYKLTGANVPQGMYEMILTQYGETNVFTIIRGLLSDYGLILSSIMMSIIGVKIKKWTCVRMNIIEHFIARNIIYIICSIIISPFNFTTVFFGYNIAFLLLILISKYKSSPTNNLHNAIN